ncbi:MAG: MerC domain-containing protein [Pseudomarimonas sp.]
MHSRAPIPTPALTDPLATLSQGADTADRVGIAGSLLCAVHCALMPLVLSLLPALGVGLLDSVDLDQAFVIFATLLGIATLSTGFRRHRTHHAWALLVPGLAMVWLGSFTSLHDHSIGHALMMTVGGLFIAAAHFANLRLTHRSANRVFDTPSDAELA